jgi:hypothetical protein
MRRGRARAGLRALCPAYGVVDGGDGAMGGGGEMGRGGGRDVPDMVAGGVISVPWLMFGGWSRRDSGWLWGRSKEREERRGKKRK